MTFHLATDPTVSKTKAPGPSLFASLKALNQMATDPIHLFEKLHHQYGDIVRLNLGLNQLFIINNADSIKYVLHKNISNYNKLKRLEQGTKRIFGEGWTQKINREIIRPFFEHQYYVGMDAAIAEITQKMLDRWAKFADSHQPLDVAQEMMRLCLSFTVKTLIGYDLQGEDDEMAQAMETIMDYFNSRAISNFNIPENIPTPANRKYLAAVRTLETAIDRIIEDRRNKKTEKLDLISVLLSWRDEETGKGLDSQLLRERLLWILLPAFEPLGRVLSWIWYLLSLHPNAESQIHAELQKVLGDRQPTFEDVPHLTYTKMVIQETLRLYPPFWVLGREAIQDDQVGGFHIPAKSILLFNLYGVQHNPNYWDNPEIFDPERFSPERSKNRSFAAFIPFSIGPRACLGYNLSLMQIALVVAMVAQAYRLKLVSGHRVEPAAMASLVPRHGIQMNVFPRL